VQISTAADLLHCVVIVQAIAHFVGILITKCAATDFSERVHG
jgi:hypothetical protein